MNSLSNILVRWWVGNGNTVSIFTVEEYEQFVKEFYVNNRKKKRIYYLKIFLMDL